MYKEALRCIEGLELGPIIAIVIFFCFFVGLFFYVFGYKKTHTTKMENLPLDNSNRENENSSEQFTKH